MLAKPVPPNGHDHGPCATRALLEASNAANANGVRLTPLRHYVLEILLASHKPLGAYDILSALAREDSPARPSPPTVYRALDFLLEQGFIHRVVSRNAFVACFSPGKRHRAHLLICRTCGQVGEMADRNLEDALDDAAGRFRVEQEHVELHGQCEECAGRP